MWNVREPGTAGWLHPECARGSAGTPTLDGIIPKLSHGSIPSAAIALTLGGLLHAMPAQAIEFGEGEFQGSLDTTISHGMTFRVQKRNSVLAEDTNGNDGDLNYDRGLVSNTSKFTTDLDIGAGDFGAFVRATGFIDFENQNGTRERTPLSDDAQDRVGKNLQVLDAYATAAFDVGEAIVDFRLGKHVLNWGESTFIPNGINAINHFDVSKLRLPGSELREALLPVGLASMSVAPTDTLAVEGFYQLDWEETEIDPVGSYFSSSDYVGPGAMRAVVVDPALEIPGIQLGDRGVIDGDTLYGPFGVEANPYFMNVIRGPDRTPDDSGQWGLALRFLAEELNNTEFGFYFINHHSRLPTVGAETGTLRGIQAGLGRAGAVVASAPAAVPAIIGSALAAAGCASPRESLACGTVAADTQRWATAVVPLVAAQAGIDAYTETGKYFLEYPENIQLFGLSFNTVLGAAGWALQGEYSLRRDAPLQRAERAVIAEGLVPITDALGLAACASNPAMARCPKAPDGTNLPPQFFNSRLQAHVAGHTPTIVQGYIERNVSQVQATATKVFGPTMRADALVFVAEAALMHVHDMPEKSTAPLESPAGGVLATGDADADATSWGYRIAARLDYNNAIGAVNLYPYTQFLHDVSGNSPAPSGPFVEGRTALTVGLRADYLSRWQASLGYTRYAGDGNELADRDFISASVKYSF